MRSTFNLLLFPNTMSPSFFIRKGYVLSGEIAPKNNHYSYVPIPDPIDLPEWKMLTSFANVIMSFMS